MHSHSWLNTTTLRRDRLKGLLLRNGCGAKYRRLKGRLSAPKAIVAMAHHLARLVYRMLRYECRYLEKGMAEYEIRLRLQRLKREAKSFDTQLLPA